MKVHSIGHIVLKVRDLERSVPFYTEVLGMKLVARNDRPMAFLTFEDNHHDIALIQTGKDAPDTPERAPGLGHLALKIGTEMSALHEAKRWLDSHGVEIGRIRDHAVTKSIYFTDPDGNEIEVFVEDADRGWLRDPQLISTGVPMAM